MDYDAKFTLIIENEPFQLHTLAYHARAMVNRIFRSKTDRKRRQAVFRLAMELEFMRRFAELQYVAWDALPLSDRRSNQLARLADRLGGVFLDPVIFLGFFRQVAAEINCDD